MTRIFMIAALLFVTLSQPGAAQESVRDQLIQQLSRAGYTELRVGRTLLGRLRIVARKDDRTREIVVNPTTGVILRDYTRVSRGVVPGDGGGLLLGGEGDRRGRDRDDRDRDDSDDRDRDDEDDRDRDRDDRDDDDDDDDDRDNSGRGSSSSGSGSGGDRDDDDDD